MSAIDCRRPRRTPVRRASYLQMLMNHCESHIQQSLLLGNSRCHQSSSRCHAHRPPRSGLPPSWLGFSNFFAFKIFWHCRRFYPGTSEGKEEVKAKGAGRFMRRTPFDQRPMSGLRNLRAHFQPPHLGQINHCPAWSTFPAIQERDPRD